MPKLLSKKEFLCLARKTHGYKYEYERTDYKGFRKKIVITCPKHGDFIQLVAKHIRGQGCPQCAIQTRTNLFSSDKATFVSKAEKVHAGKYSYEYTNYVNDRTKVSITCPLHGLFEQTPNNHLRGYGCIQCGGTARSNRETFIRKAKAIHGDFYDYSETKYLSRKTKVKIICPIHGSFFQEPSNHLSGKGCSGCKKSGFDQTKPATLYAIRSDCGQYVKVGITNNFRQRFSKLKRVTPFDVSVIERIECDGQTARQFEKMFHDKFESAGFTGFDGATEWLRWSTELQYWLRLLK